ncbi:MBOAT family O-acyltransferase [Chloroflexota bacterium]
MIFSSTAFLFGFLAIFLAIYHAIPQKFTQIRNLFVLVVSYLFYAWGAPGFVPLLFFSTVADYLLGLLLVKTGRRKLILAISLGINLGLLGYFKYTNFFIAEVSGVLSLVGFDPLVWTQIALPLGISFFTFQKISYIVDVYRGVSAPQRNFIAFALYVALFPKLIAGPIVQYHDISAQFAEREHTIGAMYEGLIRFCHGLGKKVLIADTIGVVADTVFQLSSDDLTMPIAWLGALCYTFQIYFDFAGYSDMAIGIGRMIGFRLPENFNSPYISTDIRDFWRRWHMSLTNWLRDYLYIPLGGNRVSQVRTHINLWAVFVLCGLWHGANWTFLVWGAYHGTLLTVHRVLPSALIRKIPGLLQLLGTFVLVLIAWVFFRSDAILDAFKYIGVMFDLRTLFSVQDIPFIINSKGWFFLAVAAILSFCPYLYIRFPRMQQAIIRSAPTSYVGGVAAIIILIYSAITLSGSTYNPFIYFRF